MRVLVVYATKYGYTALCAEMLAERMRGLGAEVAEDIAAMLGLIGA